MGLRGGAASRQAGPAPWLTVWGGKLTTFRVLSEQAAQQVGSLLGEPVGEGRRAWTAHATLPGGDMGALMGEAVQPGQAHAQFTRWLQRRCPWLPEAVLRRWVRSYGAAVTTLLGEARSVADLGPEIAPGVHECELRYLWQHEWARTGQDVLWRRSKLGLHLSPAGREAVERWCALTAQQGGVASGQDASGAAGKMAGPP